MTMGIRLQCENLGETQNIQPGATSQRRVLFFSKPAPVKAEITRVSPRTEMKVPGDSRSARGRGPSEQRPYLRGRSPSL